MGDIIPVIVHLSSNNITRGNKVQKFGEKLRTLRKQNGLTLSQLAEKLEFDSHSYLSAIEFGKKQPSVALVIKVATMFQVSTDSLLFDDKEI